MSNRYACLLTHNALSTKQIGDHAEMIARRYLERHGLSFITANYRCKCGEIDLILKEHQTWVFVEVKYRAQQNFGTPTEQYTVTKQRRLHNAVRLFLLDNQLNEFHTPIRIDVVGVSDTTIEWIKNVTG